MTADWRFRLEREPGPKTIPIVKPLQSGRAGPFAGTNNPCPEEISQPEGQFGIAFPRAIHRHSWRSPARQLRPTACGCASKAGRNAIRFVRWLSELRAPAHSIFHVQQRAASERNFHPWMILSEQTPTQHHKTSEQESQSDPGKHHHKVAVRCGGASVEISHHLYRVSAIIFCLREFYGNTMAQATPPPHRPNVIAAVNQLSYIGAKQGKCHAHGSPTGGR